MAKLGEFARALKFVSLIFALALGFASANAKADDSYPNRPVRIIVSFSAGGPTDIVGRVFAPKLSELLGQQFFVENKVGAGGNLGADHGREVAAGRLHAAGRDGVDPRDQSRPLFQDAVRSGQGFRAGRSGRRHADHAQRASLAWREGRERA